MCPVCTIGPLHRSQAPSPTPSRSPLTRRSLPRILPKAAEPAFGFPIPKSRILCRPCSRSPEFPAFARDNGARELTGDAVLGTYIWSWIGGPDTRLLLTNRVVRTESREPRAELLARSAPRASDVIRMCSWCNSIHIEEAGWVELEDAARRSPPLSRARQPSITHGVCPACMDSLTRMADGRPAERPSARAPRTDRQPFKPPRRAAPPASGSQEDHSG